MKLLDYFKRLNPIEGIPVTVWKSLLNQNDYRQGYLTQDFYGGLKVHVPRSDKEYPIVRCINKYYTPDAKGKKIRSSADSCYAIVNAIFKNEDTRRWLHQAGTCTACHRECLGLQEKGELWFTNRKKKF